MQENEKRIVVKKTARRAFRTEAIWQYDVGHVLAFEGFDELPETFQVHFSRSMMGEAVTMIGSGGECAVPDMYAQTAAPIYAWLYIAEDDTGLTTYLVEIPVQRRAQITDQEPTPVEQSAFDQAIAALNDGVTRAEAAQAAAEGAQAGAEGYAETAADSAITAGNAARAAAASETAAAGSASAAAGSAQDALASREGADQSASAAGVSERAAKASETAAAGSASAAAGSASAAAGSASQAAGYASTAADNARAAAGSATAADTSARAAAGSAADSQQSAQAAVAIAQGAAASAAAADGSATEAAGSASAAAGSASAAAGSATAAAGSASQAAQTAAGIETAGAAQVAAIEAKGAQVIWSIPADYSELSGDVNSLKSALNGKATVSGEPSNGDFLIYSSEEEAYVPTMINIMTSNIQNVAPFFRASSTFANRVLPEIMELDFESNTGFLEFNNVFRDSYGVKTVIIKNLIIDNIASAYSFSSADLEHIIFINCTIKPSVTENMFNSRNLIEIIGAEIDLSISTSNFNTLIPYGSGLQEIRIKKSTVKKNWKVLAVTNWSFSDDSLISIANGLDETQTGLTIQVPTTLKTYLGQIVGVNNQGVYEKDAQGTLSLADFITNVKGWTLA